MAENDKDDLNARWERLNEVEVEQRRIRMEADAKYNTDAASAWFRANWPTLTGNSREQTRALYDAYLESQNKT